MFKFIFQKEHQIESLIYDFLNAMALSQDNFLKALEACLLNGTSCENFEFFIRQTHKYESKADDIHQDINDLMYSKVLIPESRGDILELLEALDSIPDLFEHILYLIQTQKLTLPQILISEIRELVRISLESCDLVVRQTIALFKNTENMRKLLSTIDTNESHCDHIQRKMITKIFEAPEIDPIEKLQIKELIENIGAISDRTEKVSRAVNIISLKRRV